MTDEELKEKRHQHYLENKEKMLAYQKEYMKNLTPQQREARRAYHRAKYAEKKQAEGKQYNPHKRDIEPKLTKRKNPSRVKRYNLPKCIKLMKYPNDILVLSSTVKLDFIPNEESLYQAKRELAQHLLNIKREDRIVIVESWNKSVTVEVFEKDEDCMQQIINELSTFCEKLIKNLSE